jgi:tmRNA-binding protein
MIEESKNVIALVEEKLFDKRETIKNRENKRNLDRILKSLKKLCL